MKRLLLIVSCIFTLLILSCATGPNAAAIDDVDKSIADGKVLAIEYKILLNADSFKFTSNEAGEPVLTADIAKEFSDVGIIFPADKAPSKKYYYLYASANNGDFAGQGMIFRVREDRVKPAKSKITIKSRQVSFDDLDFKTVEKIAYEFDACASGKPVNDRNSIMHLYNTAMDINFNPEKDFALKDGKLEFEKVWKWLDPKYYWLQHMLRQNYPTVVDSSFPGVVDAYKFEGVHKDDQIPVFKNLEFSIDYWTLKKGDEEKNVVEVSFANTENLTVESKKALDNYYLELYKKLFDKGFVNKDQSTKTDIYFNFFK